MSAAEPIRLAALLGGLSIACDVSNGFPSGKAMRTAIVAARLARHAGADDASVADTYFASLLRYLGCTGFAHEEASVYGAGDEIGVKQAMCMADAADPLRTLAMIVSRVGRGAPALERARAVWRLVATDASTAHAHAQTDAACSLAAVMGLGRLDATLRQVCERWDGRGGPRKLTGDALSLPVRVHVLADVVEIELARNGLDEARQLARARSGAHFDPRLGSLFATHAADVVAPLGALDLFAAFLAEEPAPHACVSETELDRVVRAFGFFADLKSVYTLGHSAGVASLAARVATALGMSRSDVVACERAGHLHDLGRLSVSNRIWDHRGPLDFDMRERVRLHAYYTERVLLGVPPLASLARLAGTAHERLDGTGYPKRSDGTGLGLAARVLGACDVAQAMAEERPHRPARTRDEIARALRDPAFDPRVAEATLAAAGIAAGRAPAAPHGLSNREIEIVRLVARGKTNAEIGSILGISPRTAQAHLARIFDKLGVGSRAGAAVFAMERGLFAVGDA